MHLQDIYAISPVLDTYSFYASDSNSDHHHYMSRLPHVGTQARGSAPATSGIVPMTLMEQQTLLMANNKAKKLRKFPATPSQKSSSSSFVSRLYASQIPGETFKAAYLKVLLHNELREGICSNVPILLIDLLFPSKNLPFAVDKTLLDDLKWMKVDENGVKAPGVWTGDRFRDPPTKFTEEELAGWMNKLAQAMSNATNKAIRRSWSHHTQDTPPAGSVAQCKPDLVLLDTTYLSRIQNHSDVFTDWTFIRAIAEVTSEKRSPQRMFDTVITKSFLSFQSQPARRFTISLSFNGSGDMVFTLADREGLLRISEVNIMGGGQVSALIFLKILAVLMFGTDSDIGLDPNYKIDAFTGKVTAITVQDKHFEVENLVYSLDSLIGRATRVWVVRRNGQRFVLKDSWNQADRVDSEEKFLAAISASPRDVAKDSLPTLICGGDVTIDSIPDTTTRYRTGLVGYIRERVHRRIVCSPVGESLTNFRDKKEFIGAMIDVINGEVLFQT